MLVGRWCCPRTKQLPHVAAAAPLAGYRVQVSVRYSMRVLGGELIGSTQGGAGEEPFTFYLVSDWGGGLPVR